MLKAIIFDFDGVLVLSDKPQFRVIQQVAAKYQVAIDDSELPKIVGKSSSAFLSEILTEEEKPLLSTIHEEYEKEFKGNITKYVAPLNFSVDFIKHNTGSLIFALASVSERKVIEDLTKHFGIFAKFKTIITGDDVQKHKPDPEVYLKAVQKLEVLTSECAVVEDSVIGATAAINANMKCYILLNGSNTKKDFAQLSIAGFITSESDLYNLQ